jgi:hypothetical protein
MTDPLANTKQMRSLCDGSCPACRRPRFEKSLAPVVPGCPLIYTTGHRNAPPSFVLIIDAASRIRRSRRSLINSYRCLPTTLLLTRYQANQLKGAISMMKSINARRRSEREP